MRDHSLNIEDAMSSFSVKHTTQNHVDVISVTGFLDAHTAPQLESEIQKHAEVTTPKIVVDFQELDYISSAGMGVFMMFIEDVRSKNGDIKLAGMQPKVYSVFDLLGFPMLFDIVDSIEDAVSKFDNKDNE